MHGRTAKGFGPSPFSLALGFLLRPTPGTAMAARRRRRSLRLRRPMWKRLCESPRGLTEPSLSCRPVLPWALRPAKCPWRRARPFCRKLAVRSASAWLAHPPGGASTYPASFTLPLKFGSPPVISPGTRSLGQVTSRSSASPCIDKLGVLRSAPNRSRVVAFATPSPGGRWCLQGPRRHPCGCAPENPSCSPQGKGLWLSEWAESPYPTAPRTTRFGYETTAAGRFFRAAWLVLER